MNDLTWLNFAEIKAIPVQVVGCHDEGVWEFPDLASAKKQFPELDPYRSTDKFTWALRGEVNNGPALRFETWSAYDAYSS